MGERLLCMQEVLGSNPCTSTSLASEKCQEGWPIRRQRSLNFSEERRHKAHP